MCFKLFRKKRKETIDEDIFIPQTSSLVAFEQLDSASDEVLTKIGNEIKNGIPNIINFDLLEFDEANKAMAFLSGIVFAIDGEIFALKGGKNYMFADKHVYDDGTMHDLIREIQGD